jgi:Ankyrin repeats (3 copies)
MKSFRNKTFKRVYTQKYRGGSKLTDFVEQLIKECSKSPENKANVEAKLQELHNMKGKKTVKANGTEINAINWVNPKTRGQGLVNDTALIAAVRNKHTDIVKLLLENGANPNIQNTNGDTALIVAVCDKNKHVIELLMEKQADINIKSKSGHVALTKAVECQNLENVELILSKMAKADIDKYSVESFKHAIFNININMVQLLLKYGAVPDGYIIMLAEEETVNNENNKTEKNKANKILELLHESLKK